MMKRIGVLFWCAMALYFGMVIGLEAQVRYLGDFGLQREGDSTVYMTKLPGTVQATLMEVGVLPHHFVEHNEDSVQWVSDENWLYSTTFEVSEAEYEGGVGYRLSMEGVDTFAEVYLNGALVGRCDNFFRSYDWEVKGYLRKGVNRLVLRLLSPTRVAHAQYLSNGFMYPADNDRAEIKYSPMVRTAPYHFGWDWGPRLISMGVAAPIRLIAHQGATLGRIKVSSEIEWEGPRRAKSASVRIGSEVEGEGGRLELALYSPEGELLAKGEGGELTLRIEEPKLWMPRGWGDQPLYSVVRTLTTGQSMERDTTYFGIREIYLDRQRDEVGERFQFVVNQQPIYIKGANYLPHDRRFGGGGRSLEDIFREDILPLNLNMLRVWGGGIYETEEFYRLTDRYGILVWQDLPFACTTYPNDPAFRVSVTAEITDQMGRIGNHPSLALVCGNNEVLEGLKHWGWQRSYGYSDEIYQQMYRDYDALFREMIPAVLKEVAPEVGYIHGSPISSNWGIPESFLSGDSHNWRVWFGGKDFTEFDENPGRFASEYGFQAFPEMKTIQSFAPSHQLDTLTIYSPILKNRQRSFTGNQRITDYMKRYYPVPKSFDDYIYVGQLLQGHGMAYAIRAVRRAYPLNMGSLYWQLNDVWPTVSWSSVDYWGNHKALHYYAKAAYAPYIIDVVERDDTYQLWVVTDEIKEDARPHRALVKAYDYNGTPLWEESYGFAPEKAPFSQMVAILRDLKDQQIYLQLSLYDDKGDSVAQNIYYPLRPKEMELPKVSPTMEIRAEEGCLTITLVAERLVKDLFIETPWQGAQYSDNFFDLLPHQPYTIQVTHPDITTTTAVDSIKLTSLNALLHRCQ